MSRTRYYEIVLRNGDYITQYGLDRGEDDISTIGLDEPLVLTRRILQTLGVAPGGTVDPPVVVAVAPLTGVAPGGAMLGIDISNDRFYKVIAGNWQIMNVGGTTAAGDYQLAIRADAAKGDQPTPSSADILIYESVHVDGTQIIWTRPDAATTWAVQSTTIPDDGNAQILPPIERTDAVRGDPPTTTADTGDMQPVLLTDGTTEHWTRNAGGTYDLTRTIEPPATENSWITIDDAFTGPFEGGKYYKTSAGLTGILGGATGIIHSLQDGESFDVYDARGVNVALTVGTLINIGATSHYRDENGDLANSTLPWFFDSKFGYITVIRHSATDYEIRRVEFNGTTSTPPATTKQYTTDDNRVLFAADFAEGDVIININADTNSPTITIPEGIIDRNLTINKRGSNPVTVRVGTANNESILADGETTPDATDGAIIIRKPGTTRLHSPPAGNTSFTGANWYEVYGVVNDGGNNFGPATGTDAAAVQNLINQSIQNIPDATAVQNLINQSIQNIDPDTQIGTIAANAFGGPGAYPAADKGDYLLVTLPGTITHEGVQYDLQQGDRIRCNVDGTAVDTPANWVVQVIPRYAGAYSHVFTEAHFKDAATEYPSYDSSITTGRFALPILPGSTHGMGVFPNVSIWSSGNILKTDETNWFVHDEAGDGGLVLLSDIKFAGTMRIRE